MRSFSYLSIWLSSRSWEKYDSGGNCSGGSSVSIAGGSTVYLNGDSLTPQPQTHGTAMVTSAMTEVSMQGSNTTSAAISNLAASGSLGAQSFFSVGGGASRAETGSHVSMKAVNLSVGVGTNQETEYGLLS